MCRHAMPSGTKYTNLPQQIIIGHHVILDSIQSIESSQWGHCSGVTLHLQRCCGFAALDTAMQMMFCRSNARAFRPLLHICVQHEPQHDSMTSTLLQHIAELHASPTHYRFHPHHRLSAKGQTRYVRYSLVQAFDIIALSGHSHSKLLKILSIYIAERHP